MQLDSSAAPSKGVGSDQDSTLSIDEDGAMNSMPERIAIVWYGRCIDTLQFTFAI